MAPCPVGRAGPARAFPGGCRGADSSSHDHYHPGGRIRQPV